MWLSKVLRKLVLVVICSSNMFVFAQISLQHMINNCNALGKKVIDLEKEKVYFLDRTLIIPSGVEINGNGATLTESRRWSSLNDRFSPLILLANVSDVKISNLNINHSVNGNNIYNQASNSILMIGVQNSIIEHVTFTNLGSDIYSDKVKGSPYILMLAQDQEDDFSYLPKSVSDVLASSFGNTIKNCKFINHNYTVSFAIRLLTLWKKNRNHSNVKHKVFRNTIDACEFYGEFDWNTVELAGPGTEFNTVSNNILRGNSVNNIDVDKGASYNLIEGNDVRKSGLPTRHFYNRNVRHATICVHGSNTNLLSIGNIVRNNLVKDVLIDNPFQSNYLYSSGIAVLYTDNTTIENNSIENMFIPDKYGVAILMDQHNTNVKVISNKINNVYRGVFESMNSRKNQNVKIRDNQINVFKDAVFLKK
ncbi:hypothetical protein PG310_00365 [Riemerella anatipestifer]|uniref:hypothetical protein n=1 Tax=Riemerella anatipestifer TaxID=34085 RepID=UPI002A862EA0|nr:hypothetical protein [Riemerella anatipestifer]